MKQADQLREVEELRGEPIKTIDPTTIPCKEISDPEMLSDAPLVSVKMITYNHAPYIAEAIEGVLRQETDFPIELVVGEDCSTDGTREIVLDYQRRHPGVICVVTSEKNVGMHANSLRTYNACRGRYIAYCEGDDYWHHPKKLQLQVGHLERHPECGLVYSDVDRLDATTGRRVEKAYSRAHAGFSYSGVLVDRIINEPPLYTCTAVVRRALLDEIYRECTFEFSGAFLMKDYQTWIECAFRSRVEYIGQSLATYRILPESACRSKDPARLIAFAKNAKELALHYAAKYGGDALGSLRSRIGQHYNQHLIRCAVHAANRLVAEEAFVDAKEHSYKLGFGEYACGWAASNALFFCLARHLFPPLWEFRRRLSHLAVL